MIILNYTTERTSSNFLPDNYVFQRHLFAYQWAASLVKGHLLEVGCGNGYGLSILKSKVDNYVGVDKSRAGKNFFISNGADFFEIKVPNLKNIPSNIFDTVVSFQVIEHIRNDDKFLKEIHRVLKPGGTLFLTTPNKLMSFSRNPWHIREYIYSGLSDLLEKKFDTVEIKGLYGNELINTHLNNNKIAVEKMLRLDIISFQKWAPRFLLKLPYQVLNFYTKRKLAAAKDSLVSSISYADFFLDEPDNDCLDFYVKAVKRS